MSVGEYLAIRVNGERADLIRATDRGLHFGDGVFETIAVRDGKPELLDRHLARLRDGAGRLGFEAPDRDTLEREALEIAKQGERAVLKIIVTRGGGGRGYAPPDYASPARVMLLTPWRCRPEADYRNGARVRWCETRLAVNPLLAGIKHLNRLEQVLARAEWDDPDTAEGLMRDALGRVVEGTASNLFLVENGRLLTPDLSDCGVAGITRARVMELAEAAGMGVATADVEPGRVEDADELFLTSSLLGILPVGSLGGRELPVGPVTRRLMEILESDE